MISRREGCLVKARCLVGEVFLLFLVGFVGCFLLALEDFGSF